VLLSTLVFENVHFYRTNADLTNPPAELNDVLDPTTKLATQTYDVSLTNLTKNTTGLFLSLYFILNIFLYFCFL